MDSRVQIAQVTSPNQSTSRRGGIRMPPELRKRATAMLNQQFWIFGFDIRRAEGNLLLADGFTKHRPPAGNPITCSRYSQHLSETEAIALWGFGLYFTCAECGSIFLPRHAISPIYSPESGLNANAWDPDDLVALRQPESKDDMQACRRLLVDALGWVRDYESRVLAEHGEGYRSDVLAAWKRPACAANAIASEWANVIARLGAL